LEYRGVYLYCDNIKKLHYIAEKDKIKADIKFKDKQPVQTCYYEGWDFKEVKNSDYPNHYVDLTKGVWLDDYDATIVKLSKYKLKLEIAGNVDEYLTQSIGDLNYNNASIYFNVTNSLEGYYFNYTTYGGVDYVRNLSYVFNYSCPTGATANGVLYIGSDIVESYPATCDNARHIITDYTQYTSEGAYNSAFVFNYSGLNVSSVNQTFTWDLNNPVAYVNFTTLQGIFLTNFSVNHICTDNIAPNITYHTVFNNATLFNSYKVNNTLQNNQTTGVDGINVVIGNCSDLFSTTTAEYNQTIFLKTIIIIDEIDNVAFNLAHAKSVGMYYDENISFYDFTANNRTNITISSYANNKVRLEIGYDDGGLVTRYIDLDLVEDDSLLRLCANIRGSRIKTQKS